MIFTYIYKNSYSNFSKIIKKLIKAPYEISRISFTKKKDEKHPPPPHLNVLILDQESISFANN